MVLRLIRNCAGRLAPRSLKALSKTSDGDGATVSGLSWYAELTRALLTQCKLSADPIHKIPVVSPCLMAILFLFKRKSKHCSATVGSQKRQLWTHLREQDLFGILLLTAGIALFLLPIPLEQGGISQYASARLITPTALGFLLLLLLVVWEFKFARNPVIPRRVLSQRTIASVMACKPPPVHLTSYD